MEDEKNVKAYILLGAPGSGKGTIAERIRDAAGLRHLATGDLLRTAMKNGEPLGREAESYMKRGVLVPDDLIMKLVETCLEKGGDTASYLFDGFPRTLAQADMLDSALEKRGTQISRVFLLTVPKDVILDRLTGRRTCRKCGAVYHIRNIPPKKEGVCDVCGGELYQRADDREDTILNRLAVYDKETAPLISRYEKKGLLARVRSDRKADVVAGEILGMIRGSSSGAGER